MKKFLLIICMWGAFLVYACKKDDPIGYDTDTGCNCGLILEQDVNSQTQCYYLKVRNECTSNEKTFCVDLMVWNAFSVGDSICINDITQW